MHKSNVALPWKQERWRGSRWPVWYTARDTWPTAGPEQRWVAPTCPARFLESNIKEKTTNETAENLHLRIQHTQAFVVRQCGIFLLGILQHLLQSGHHIFIFLNTDWEGQEELTRGAKKSLTVKELLLSLLLIYSFACAWLNWTQTESELFFLFLHQFTCQVVRFMIQVCLEAKLTHYLALNVGKDSYLFAPSHQKTRLQHTGHRWCIWPLKQPSKLVSEDKKIHDP